LKAKSAPEAVIQIAAISVAPSRDLLEADLRSPDALEPPTPQDEEHGMKKELRPKKLTLKAETLRLLEADQLSAANGGGTTTVATVIFTEGACEGYSWLLRC
jgi:hypothetical protein